MKKQFIISGFAFTALLFPTSMMAQQASGEMNDSLKTVLTQAKAGDATAQNEVGAWYYRGKYVEQNYAEALQWWAKSAKQGNVQAIGNMGLCYQKGHGIEKDTVKAMQLYAKSIEDGNNVLLEQNIKLASNGDVFANVFMGYCYQKGIGTKKDQGKVLQHYTNAAKLNSIDAGRELALCYLNAQNPQEAFGWFKRSADNGDLPSTFYIGKLLYEGKGTKQDKQQGVIYYLKAAEAGFPQAQYEIANSYASGEGITKNVEQAVQWYKKAAYNGVAGAQWHLALYYVNGEGVERNYDEALYWFSEAVAKGYARAFKKLCEGEEAGIVNTPFMSYLKGMKHYVVEKSYDEAMKCFKEVEKAKCMEGKTMQGVCLANKDYPKQNLKKGVKTLQAAAKTDAVAMYLLGTLYEAGRGVEKNMDQAVSYITQSAEKGYATAICHLGDMYYEGRGVAQDYSKAVACYQLADKQSRLNQSGRKRLASCYENSWGNLPVDKKKAEALLKVEKKNNVPALLNAVQ